MAGAPVMRRASRRNAAFRVLLSTRCTSASGVRRARRQCTRPGNPPPEPRSTHTARLGGEIEQLQRIGDVARPQIGNGRRPISGSVRCQLNSSSTKRSSRSSVSRETGVSASARARSALRSSGGTTRRMTVHIFGIHLCAESTVFSGSRVSLRLTTLVPLQQWIFDRSRPGMHASLKLTTPRRARCPHPGGEGRRARADRPSTNSVLRAPGGASRRTRSQCGSFTSPRSPPRGQALGSSRPSSSRGG